MGADSWGKSINDNNRRIQPKRGYLRGKSGRDMIRKKVKIQDISSQAAERAKSVYNAKNWTYLAIIIGCLIVSYYAFSYFLF